MAQNYHKAPDVVLGPQAVSVLNKQMSSNPLPLWKDKSHAVHFPKCLLCWVIQVRRS